jgi:pilus assembly protein CpaE
MTRKAMNMLGQFGFPKERFHVLLNRVDKRADIGASTMEKLFNCPVYASLPNDYFSLHRVVTLGQPLGPDGDLGKAIENVATRLTGAVSSRGKSAPPVPEMHAQLLQT